LHIANITAIITDLQDADYREAEH